MPLQSASESADLERVLTLLYGEWFRAGDGQPLAIWLVEFQAGRSSDDWFIQMLWPKRVYFLNGKSMQHKSGAEWQRYYTAQFVQPWNTRTVRVWPSEIEIGIFEIGQCWFSVDEDGSLMLTLSFGPNYGRGYRFDASGSLVESWVS